MKNDLISIILPVYNGEKHISKSIESCLNQTYTNIEIIIVNDCSTDKTSEIVNRYLNLDGRIKVVHNKVNKKLPASLNIGHRDAQGLFFTWTSDDNIYEPDAIEEMAKALYYNQADVVYSDFYLIDENDIIKKETQLPEIGNFLFGNIIGASFLYKREVYERNAGYNESLFLVEDYDFWLRAFEHSKFKHIKKALYKYRTHKDSLSSEIRFNDKKQKLWKENCNKMYFGFFSTYLKDYESIAAIFADKLTGQYIDFGLLKKENKNITLLKDKLKQNRNISSDKIVETAFLKQFIKILVNNQDDKSNFGKSMFILKKYILVLDKNSFKTLIKYSFFK
ncbi:MULTISPECIES: glycosyltransferase family 2 protein [Flavobacterium]|uniref:glycosyltransferase family 2 protein n=1 Tax=Flavobacterium TaxID=237 RepID=UPI001FCA9AF6|nr:MULTISPECIES: glycosyltransferase [Flavobacterium]UOK43786.1 glycosyltransferase [Flavobacterium enshiense]